MVTLDDVAKVNSGWFSESNKRFFGDKSYSIEAGTSGKIYLVRSTEAWTDMFDGIRKLHYRINNLDQTTLKIQSLIDDKFKTMNDVKEWLKQN